MTLSQSGSLLLAARRDPANRPAALPNPPGDTAAAYAIQQEVMAQLGPIGGWKVGYTPATGQFTCAPLPSAGIVRSPAKTPQQDCPDRGVEAEIALMLAQDLPPRSTPYASADIEAAIASVHPAIELLQSRYQDIDQVGPLSALADSLSHYSLVIGPEIPFWDSVDFAAEEVRVLVNGREIKRATANPAGPMLPLLVWMANEGAVWAGGLRAGQFVTTGSWTGKDFVPPGATVTMRFDHCGMVEARYT